MNKRTARIALVVLIGLVAVYGGLNAQTKVGTTAAQFLGIPVGARSLAMGSAAVAQQADVSSLYWNPGAAAQTQTSEFAFVNTNWLVDTKFQWFGVLLKLDADNTFGASLTQLDYGEEQVTTVDEPNGTDQRWSARDLAISLSYARRLTDRFSVGGSAKYISQTIWNESASTVTFDVGLLFVTGFHGMRLGMSLSNFGGDLQLDGRDLLNPIDIDADNAGGNKTLVGKLKTDAWPTPVFFRVGLALDVVSSESFTATVAADAVRPNDNQEVVNVGGEVSWMKMLFLRAGYKSLGMTDSQEGLTLGAGVRYSFDGLGSLGVDYAYNEFGLFGNLNTLAIHVGF